MNTLNFNHELTPKFLQAVNTQLAACLSLNSPETPTDEIRKLVILRDKLVNRYLKRLTTADAKRFAELELPVNEQLEKLARGLLDFAKSEAVQYVRGRAAIKKYK